MFRIAILTCGLLALLSCASRKEGAGKEKAGDVKSYTLAGEIIRLDEQHSVATIKHGPILDSSGKVWMEGMTMDFPVRGEGEFAKLRVGLTIRATVHQRESDYDYWIDQIQPGSPPGSAPAK